MNYNSVLEFDKIKEMLNKYASTDYGKEKIEQMSPILSEIGLKHALDETDGARTIIDSVGSPRIPSVTEIKSLLEIADKDGLLYPEQLEKIVHFISSCKSLKSYLKKAEVSGRSLAYSGIEIDTLDGISTEILNSIRGDSVDSNASKELCRIRRGIDTVNAQIKTKLEEILRSRKECFSEGFVSVRNGHYTLPVKREFKSQFSGTVVDTSGSGGTYFIEPSPVTRLTEKLSDLESEEYTEVTRILYELTALVCRDTDKFKRNIELCEMLDFAFAKGRFSSELKAVTPHINTDRVMKIVKGRHPLLNADICVPLNFEIGGEIRGIVITGPNTGGKTVALKLVGLFALMAQCGLHLPCESADICMNSNVLCDIGDGQNISENLSTFSAHITNIVNILENTGKDTLVLLDELGSGTDPSEGMCLAIAILDELRRRKCLFVATTHYAEVKKYAEEAPNLINARMTFDKETLKPQYQLVIGEAGESCAFYIARRLGFPEHLLELAYEQAKNQSHGVGTVAIDFSKDDKYKINSGKVERIIKAPKIKQISEHALSFRMGDSVTVLPEKEIGIIYKSADDLGDLVVQIKGRKVKINHKKLELKTPASELYPPDYDFSIIFDSVAQRKARHQMSRKHVEGLEIEYTEEVPESKK